jgi:hypothetical protein
MDIGHVTWRKASYSTSNGGGCVEVASTLTAVVAVRDSKDPDGPELAFTLDGWQTFTWSIKSGPLDPD